MRAVRSANTTPEIAVRKLAHALGYRFRLHRKDLPGKPDIVFPSRQKAIFVHGCFWHGHDCKRGAREPKTNAEYWRRKIARNRERDVSSIKGLRRAGWKSMIVWECQVRNEVMLSRRIDSFLACRNRATKKAWTKIR
jgi:DNA mismatch endonuclease (patch repair protein)